MRNVVLILSFLVMAFIIACGNENSQKKQTAAEQKTVKTDTNYVFETDFIKVKLGEGWANSADGAKSRVGCNVISYTVEKAENLRDLFDKDLEQVGAITDTTVDGQPAVTRVEKYAKKKPPMIGRIWFIDNDKNVIVFKAFAPPNVFDDNIAKEIVGYVKIKRER